VWRTAHRLGLVQLQPRFYLIALVFIIFEVDIALTFPVVVVYAAWVKKGARGSLLSS